MAFTYAVAKVDTLTVGTQIRAAVATDGHAYVYPTPASGSGLAYPTTVRAIFPAAVPAGTDNTGSPITNTSVLWTVQLNNSSVYALPTDFTLNDTTDFVVTATGTA